MQGGTVSLILIIAIVSYMLGYMIGKKVGELVGHRNTVIVFKAACKELGVKDDVWNKVEELILLKPKTTI